MSSPVTPAYLSFNRLRIAGAELALAAFIGVLAGTASAGFLVALEAVTRARFAHSWLLALLPLAGVLSVWAYRRAGKQAERGNNLILDAIHQPGGGVPLRLVPLVLGGTLLTHLCGGSAGREGTAVQMGGALADGVRRAFRLGSQWQGVALSCGVAGGFGAVFGTPLAGAVFALEVLVRGRMHYAWAMPCLLSALVGDKVCAAWGVSHVDYAALAGLAMDKGAGMDALTLLKVAGVGLVCGLVAKLFTSVVHTVSSGLDKVCRAWWQKPLLGGAAVGGLAWLIGTDAYLGLGTWHPDSGVVSLMTVFKVDGAEPWSWLGKLVFTALTVGAGFKGGEVTPLFFIGATLGYVVGPMLGLPVALGAALGFVGVFAGASKTPLACTLLAIEVFGGAHAGLFAVACFASYACSGANGIYKAQR